MKFLEKIGEGAFAKVYRAEWKGETVAAKQLAEHLFIYGDDDVINRFRVEYQTHLGLHHPNIVKMHGMVESENVPPVLITELLYRDLKFHIEKSAAISLHEALKITIDVAEGLRYLHTRRLPTAHRDLSSKNVLLTKDGQAKVADLGLAKVFVSCT